MVKSQFKQIKTFIYATAFSILSGCNYEPKILMQRVPYEGNELRIDGYYYHRNNDSNARTNVCFLFRNGVMFNSGTYWTNDLDEVEQNLTTFHEKGWFDKQLHGWGVFNVNVDRFENEQWCAICGHVLRYVGRVENDTTIHLLQCIDPLAGVSPMDEIYKFKKFSPKPDSIKFFIK